MLTVSIAFTILPIIRYVVSRRQPEMVDRTEPSFGCLSLYKQLNVGNDSLLSSWFAQRGATNGSFPTSNQVPFLSEIILCNTNFMKLQLIPTCVLPVTSRNLPSYNIFPD